MLPEPLVILGGGRAGACLLAALAQHLPVTVVVRSQARRAALEAWRLGVGLQARLVPDQTSVAEVGTLLLAVPDRHLHQAAAEWAGRGQIWLHLSGVAPVSVLDVPGAPPVRGSAHPLCALPDPVALNLQAGEAAAPLHGALLALAGGAEALAAGRVLADRLGAVAWPVPDRARATYHAAAALVANDLVALLHAGEILCQDIDLPPEVARPALVHLARTALDALAAVPAEGSLALGLTGAVARGDAATVARHLTALQNHPELQALHQALSRRLVTLAEQGGTLPPDRVQALRDLLDS